MGPSLSRYSIKREPLIQLFNGYFLIFTFDFSFLTVEYNPGMLYMCGPLYEDLNS